MEKHETVTSAAHVEVNTVKTDLISHEQFEGYGVAKVNISTPPENKKKTGRSCIYSFCKPRFLYKSTIPLSVAAGKFLSDSHHNC